MRTRKKIKLIQTTGSLILFLLSVTLILSRTSEAQDISNWKTYTNEEYKYELKYPPDLIIKYPDSVLRDTVSFKRNSKTCFCIDVLPISSNARQGYMGEMRYLTTFSLKDHIVSIMMYNYEEKIPDEKVMKMIRWKPITIGGIEGMQAEGSDKECIDKYIPISVFKKNSELYRFSIYYGSANEYNTMLSTFRFINN